MKRKLSNRQVTWLGVLIGLLISGGIFGLWSAVRHINNEEVRAQEAKDSARTEHREQLAVEIAKEQALQDSITTYQQTHSSNVLASRMQVILSDELRHAGQRPYYDKYRTQAFREDLAEVMEFDKEPREEKPGMTFMDMPFYQLIPSKMIRDMIINRIYYVTDRKARVDVRYLVKRVEKIEEGDNVRDTTYYERKTATYKLFLQDDEWLVDDRIIDYLSERTAFKRYMDGEYFIDPIEEVIDSLASDSLAGEHERTIQPEKPKSEMKKKEEPKKTDNKKKEEPKKSDSKKNDEQKKNDVKKKEDTKKADTKKTETKKTETKKTDTKKTDTKKNDTKKNDTKKTDTKKTDTKKTDTNKKNEENKTKNAPQKANNSKK